MPRLPDPRFAPDCALLVDGRAVPARHGESLAVALVAAGRPLLSRSYKYHRPRGPYCLAGNCGSCLVRVDGVPNLRACETPCRDGMRVETQNAWPSAAHDALGAIDWLAPGGLDVHHMLTRPALVNRVMVGVSRRLAGLGRLPDSAGSEPPPATEERFDALVLGAGPAGLGAAEALARGARRLLLVERAERLGGRLRARLDLPGDPDLSWAEEVASAVERAGGEVARSTALAGLFTDGGTPACLLLARGAPERARLVRAAHIVVCTGGVSSPPAFESGDLPGVFAGRALAVALTEHGVLAGRRAAVVGEGPEAEALADRLRGAGMAVESARGEVARALGRLRVRGLLLRGGERLECDSVAEARPPVPAAEALRALGVPVRWDEAAGAFLPEVDPSGRTAVPGLFAAGEVARAATGAEAADGGRRAGEAALG